MRREIDKGAMSRWIRTTFEPIMEMLIPRVYGAFPTLFGVPLAETEQQLREADVAFLGVPWRAPTMPSSFLIGGVRSKPPIGARDNAERGSDRSPRVVLAAPLQHLRIDGRLIYTW